MLPLFTFMAWTRTTLSLLDVPQNSAVLRVRLRYTKLLITEFSGTFYLVYHFRVACPDFVNFAGDIISWFVVEHKYRSVAHVVSISRYAVGSKIFRPDIQKPRQMENAVRDI